MNAIIFSTFQRITLGPSLIGAGNLCFETQDLIVRMSTLKKELSSIPLRNLGKLFSGFSAIVIPYLFCDVCVFNIRLASSDNKSGVLLAISQTAQTSLINA
jgi:hypothetical protein